MRSPRPRSLALVAGEIICFLLLAGCSSPSASLTLPEKNIDQWVNPLDQFVPQNFAVGSYAELLLDSRCMRTEGYDWSPPWKDTQAEWGPSWNEAERRLFNVSLAKQYGYHEAPGSGRSNPEWDAFTASKVNLSDSESAALNACTSKSRKKLKDPGPVINLALSYISTAVDEANSDEEVVKAAKTWRECMQPFGIYDLPDSPQHMPTKELMKKFGVSNAPGDNVRAGSAASAEEIKLATADAECRVSSRYEQASYDAEWDASVKLYRENADELERARTALKAYHEQVKVVLSENTPSK